VSCRAFLNTKFKAVKGTNPPTLKQKVSYTRAHQFNATMRFHILQNSVELLNEIASGYDHVEKICASLLNTMAVI
jgi:hypothetical protein